MLFRIMLLMHSCTALVQRKVVLIHFAGYRIAYITPQTNTNMSDNKVIFSMEGVSKSFSPGKKVLNNIWLSFFYGAKIGVLGLNGNYAAGILEGVIHYQPRWQEILGESS